MSRPEPNRHARRAARAAQGRKGALATSAAAGLLAASGAQATTYDESVDGDLPESFAARLMLPVGTDEVIGEVNPDLDQDHFAFQSLAPGASFDMTLEPPIGPSVNYLRLNDAGAVVEQDCLFGSPGSFTGTVPASGLVNLSASGCEGTAT